MRHDDRVGREAIKSRCDVEIEIADHVMGVGETVMQLRDQVRELLLPTQRFVVDICLQNDTPSY